MSWMRDPVYCWGDGERVHLWARRDTEAKAFHPIKGTPDPAEEDCDYPGFTGGLSMPQGVFDVLALYRAAELMQNPKAFRKAVKAAKKASGNFGSWAFLESLGEDPAGEFRKRMEAIRSQEVSSVIAPFILGRTPPPPGQQATTERETALIDRVFPPSEGRQRACERWPTEAHRFARVRDDGRAEAALLAEYGRRCGG